MSGSSYNDSTKGVAAYDSWRSEDRGVRVEVERKHREDVAEARGKIMRGEAVRPPTVNRDLREVTDPTLARNRITTPSKSARRAIVVLIDHSGSNRAISSHLRDSSGYLMSLLRAIDPDAEVAFIYFSDHGDRSRMHQYSDFVPPTPVGDKILFNSLNNVENASGQDFPEALECTLAEAAKINFGHIAKKDRTIIVVTDSVAHGMGHEEDDGCPDQVDWRQSMEDVRETYGNFILIGSGANPRLVDLQKKLFEVPVAPVGQDPYRTAPMYDLDKVAVALNFIDLSKIKSAAHRNGIVGNAIMFVIARNTGPQGVMAFLATLYAKWLKNPIFGEETDVLAKTRIRSLAELYLPGIMTREAIEQMLTDIFAE